jgi:hypothetical protein
MRRGREAKLVVLAERSIPYYVVVDVSTWNSLNARCDRCRSNIGKGISLEIVGKQSLTCNATSLESTAEFSHVIVGSRPSMSVKFPSRMVI